MNNCNGSIATGKACYECDQCIDKMRRVVLKYKTMPMCHIPKKDAMIFAVSCTELLVKYGPAGFQSFLKGEM